jgi:hypothetical protein
MRISLTFLEGTWICARQGLRKIDIDFTGKTLGDLLGLLPENLGPEVEKDLKDPALQLILNGRILTVPFDLQGKLYPEDHLTPRLSPRLCRGE